MGFTDEVFDQCACPRSTAFLRDVSAAGGKFILSGGPVIWNDAGEKADPSECGGTQG